MNVQLAVKDRQVYVLEVNPRASRTVPFVAKATGRPLAKIAAKVMVGRTLDELGIDDGMLPMHVAVKESVFPFSKFPGVDTILGPEMRSTGEVMGIATSVALAFGKSLSASGFALPSHGRAFISVQDGDKAAACFVARRLRNLGFKIVATGGTAEAIARARIPVERINKVLEGSPHVVDAIRDGTIQLVINTTQGAKAIRDSYSLRRNALLANIPYFTTMAAGVAAVDALEVSAQLGRSAVTVKSVQEWHSRAI
jgi:carbamoyl-phosphate synthase large subunit